MIIYKYNLMFLICISLCFFYAGLPAKAQDTLNENIRLVGRFHREPNKISAEWPRSMVEIRFEGSQLDVTIFDSGENYLAIEVDGNPRLLKTQRGEHTYSIVNNENISGHVVRLIKRTEAAFGQVIFRSWWTDGNFTTPIEERKKYLF